jgi:hypothetical protein
MSILTKGLLLVAVPLVCEAIFVIWLIGLQQEATSLAEQEAKARRVADSIQEIFANVASVTAQIRGYALSHLGESHKSGHEAFAKMLKATARLREDLKDDPRSIAVIYRTEKGVTDAKQAIEDLEDALFAGRLEGKPASKEYAVRTRQSITIAGASQQNVANFMGSETSTTSDQSFAKVLQYLAQTGSDNANTERIRCFRSSNTDRYRRRVRTNKRRLSRRVSDRPAIRARLTELPSE